MLASTFLFCRYQNSYCLLPYCFKNASDADKAIEDHVHATQACTRFIKRKKDLIQKVNIQSDRKITKPIFYFSMLTE